MSELEFVCPYCEKTMKIETEGMTEFDYGEETCSKCKNTFEYNISYSVDTFTRKKQ